MEEYSNVPTRHLVLFALLNLSGGGSGLCVKATIKNILKNLKQEFGRVVTRTRLEQLLHNLESQNYVYREKGLLSDGRVQVYGIKSHKIDREMFTIIKDSEKAVVYGDKYAGIICDAQSLCKIDLDLSDGLDELHNKLKSIRDSFFNKKPSTTETLSNKAHSFDGWGPDSQKMMEDLEKALWTRSTVPQ